jgi:hypothetical protein
MVATAVSALPVELAANLPVANALAGEQSDAAVLPADRPTATFSSVAASVTSLQWWGYDLAGLGGPDAFVVRINGTPVTGSLSVMAGSPETAPGVDVLRYTLNLSSAFNVAAGASALSVVNDTDTVEWYWQAGSTLTNRSMSYRVIGELSSTVPVTEPGVLALVAAALVALRLARRAAV